jgi:alanyl-tRNA synthetase
MRTAEIREKYLSFFESKGHLRLPSFSLIPENDPSLLFTSAGMAPLKPYFLGAKPIFGGREWRRITTCQKCLRVGDIENVGRTGRHNTFFEMLGNFSFGDYFKKEAILWAWEFLTEHLKLDPERLWVTVYEDDDEAYAIWRDLVGVPEEKIGRFGEDENYWPGGAITHGPNGPSGPCSEIFYDRGPAFGTPDETGPNTGSGDRFVEIWNLVFTQYDRQGPIPGPGILKPLPQKNIDTGMGLYRVAAILQDVEDFYRTDTFYPIIERVALLSGRPYLGKESVSHRVIADHVRAVVAALADGVTFSNTGRGYVIRRLLRRALRHGYLLGLAEPFLHRLAPVVAELLGDFYPEMRENLPAVEKQIRLEEERFLETLEGGLRRLDALLSGLKPGEVLPGQEAFRLYDTYGFPLDLTVEIAAERGYGVDTEGFKRAMEEQQERSRSAMAFEREIFKKSAQVLEELYAERGATEFLGYGTLEAEAQVLALLAGDESLPEAGPGTEVQVVLDRTPFYAEGGGQIGDFGLLEWPGGRARVETTLKTERGIFLHRARVEEGVLRVGERVRAVVDPRRRDTERNHTATHLLHAALRAVLGPHVRQAGSLVAPDRLRFDFTHPEPLKGEELERIELLVNRWIMADFPVTWRYLPLEEAKKEGAMALFGEKYGEVVRVVRVEGSPVAGPRVQGALRGHPRAEDRGDRGLPHPERGGGLRRGAPHRGRHRGRGHPLRPGGALPPEGPGGKAGGGGGRLGGAPGEASRRAQGPGEGGGEPQGPAGPGRLGWGRGRPRGEGRAQVGRFGASRPGHGRASPGRRRPGEPGGRRGPGPLRGAGGPEALQRGPGAGPRGGKPLPGPHPAGRGAGRGQGGPGPGRGPGPRAGQGGPPRAPTVEWGHGPPKLSGGGPLLGPLRPHLQPL